MKSLAKKVVFTVILLLFLGLSGQLSTIRAQGGSWKINFCLLRLDINLFRFFE